MAYGKSKEIKFRISEYHYSELLKIAKNNDIALPLIAKRILGNFIDQHNLSIKEE